MTQSSSHNHPIKKTHRKRWLCIAYAFAPIQRSGTHRTVAFVKHLDKLGWDATVLTVKADCEPVDDALMKNVPSSTTIVRTRWIHPVEGIKNILAKCIRLIRKNSSSPTAHLRQTESRHTDGSHNLRTPHKLPTSRDFIPRAARTIKDWVSRLMMIPDSRIGWIPFAVWRGYQSIKKQPPEIIYSTSPYMSAHLIALILSGLTRKPWVADFRDPWGGNPYRHLQFSTLKWWDGFLERLVLKNASHIVSNTPTMRTLICRRYPFVAKKCSTILNGFDSDRLANIQPVRVAPLDVCVFTHCGQFYGQRSPQVWFEALKRTLEQHPNLQGKIKLQLLGPDHYEGEPLKQMASAMGVADHVIIAGSKNHHDTLSLMVGSDALLLAGYEGLGGELQVPNKLFEYLAIRKPIIAGIAKKNPSVDIINNANAPALICNPNNADSIANAFNLVAEGQLDGIENAFSGADQYDRKHRAVELEKLFRQWCHQDSPLPHYGIVSAAHSFVGRFRTPSPQATRPTKDVVSSGASL